MTDVFMAVNSFDASDVGQRVVAAGDAVLAGNALVIARLSGLPRAIIGP